MNPNLNLVLLGFMGTGKSAVGRILARRLGRPFVEMDAEIERRAGRGIPEIFASEGETGFRAMEREWIREQTGLPGRVIATGRPDDVLRHPQVVESYLGTSSAAIARSGRE